jgi:hypothetical protein
LRAETLRRQPIEGYMARDHDSVIISESKAAGPNADVGTPE